MPHPLAHHRLPGIGPMRQARLEEAGIRTLEQLLQTPLETLAELPGFHGSLAERAIAAALSVLESAPAEPVAIVEVDEAVERELPPAVTEPIDPSLRRGLDVARRIEETRGWVRTVRARVKAPKLKGKKKKKQKVRFQPERQELRRELKLLVKTLGRIQREAIMAGLSEAAADDLDQLLSKIERRLEKFSGRALDVDRIVKITGRMMRARRSLKARLT